MPFAIGNDSSPSGAARNIADTSPSTARPLAEGDIGDEVAWAIVDSAPDGIVVVDDTGAMLLVNKQLESMFGYDRGELLGRPVDHLLPTDLVARHCAHRDGCHAAPSVRFMGHPVDGNEMQLEGRCKDGTALAVEISLSPVQGPSGSCTIAAVRDVRERLAAERMAQEAHDRAKLLEDRERIGRDLHDTVIQELFAVGMGLQSLAGRLPDGAHRDRARALVDNLDEVIRDIRTAIFGATAHQDWGRGLKGRILRLAAESRTTLGFEPVVSFEGEIDTIPDSVAAELIPCIREALSNAAKHARASRAEVHVHHFAGWATAVVRDNGVGLPQGPELCRGHGLDNMEARARLVGGHCEIGMTGQGGCVVTWHAPTDGIRGNDGSRS